MGRVVENMMLTADDEVQKDEEGVVFGYGGQEGMSVLVK